MDIHLLKALPACSREIQVRTGIGIFVGEGIVGWQFLRLIVHVTLGDGNLPPAVAMIYILAQTREKVEQPQALLTVQIAGVLLELPGGIYTIFLRVILDLSHVVGMFCSILAVAVSPEAVHSSQRILKEEPFLLLALHVAGIVALHIGKPVAAFLLHPYVIIGWSLLIESLGDDGILHRDGIDAALGKMGKRDFRFRISRAVPEIRLALHRTGFCSIIGQELRRIIRHSLHLRLPGKEIVFQKILGRIGELIHSGSDHREGEFLPVAGIPHLVDLCRECLHDVLLDIRSAVILQLKSQQRKDDVFHIYRDAVLIVRRIGVLNDVLLCSLVTKGKDHVCLRVVVYLEDIHGAYHAQGIWI